jgi:hypothetical protein
MLFPSGVVNPIAGRQAAIRTATPSEHRSTQASCVVAGRL